MNMQPPYADRARRHILPAAIVLVCLICLFPAAGKEKQKDNDKIVTPQIVRVHNGDTIDVMAIGRRRLQLVGIDAPEDGQPLAKEAREYLVQILNDPELRYERSKGDAFDRIAALQKLTAGIIIPELKFEDKPLSELMEHLMKFAKEKDPKGVGFTWKLKIVPKPPPTPPVDQNDPWGDGGGDAWGDDDDAWGDDGTDGKRSSVTVEQTEPTVTMHFSNIPLSEAIRYICQCCGVFYMITPDGYEGFDAQPKFTDLPISFKVSLYSPKQKARISYLMLRKGLAWYVKDDKLDPALAKELAAAQEQAQKEKLGIWGLKAKPIAPWEFRKKKSDKH